MTSAAVASLRESFARHDRHDPARSPSYRPEGGEHRGVVAEFQQPAADHPPIPHQTSLPSEPRARSAGARGGTEQPAWRMCWAVGAVVGSACAALYVHGLGRGYTYDESVTVAHFIHTPSVLDAFRLQIVNNNHPFLSFADHLIGITTGSYDEVTMRLVPLVAGIGGVVVLAAVCARRLGLWAGMAAGAFLGFNPFYASEAQSVRGYSLLLFCAISSTALVLDQAPSRWRRAAYVAAVAVGIATHVYMVPVVVCHVVSLRARKQLDRTWVRLILAGSVLGLLAVVLVLAQTATGRGQAWHPELPGDIIGLIFPGPVAAALLLPVASVGLWHARDRPDLLPVAAAILAMIATMMLIVRPYDLYARFFCWVLPLAALAVAAAVRAHRRVALGTAVVGTAAVLATQFGSYGVTDTANQPAASVVTAARAHRLRVCGVGDTFAIDAYTTDFVHIDSVSQIPECDVAFNIDVPWAHLDATEQEELRAVLPVVAVYPAEYAATIFSRSRLPGQS